jgi:hypothetical protein
MQGTATVAPFICNCLDSRLCRFTSGEKFYYEYENEDTWTVHAENWKVLSCNKYISYQSLRLIIYVNVYYLLFFFNKQKKNKLIQERLSVRLRALSREMLMYDLWNLIP